MLILTRKRGETIVIDGDIRVTIVDVRGDRVLVGITAPADTPVHRAEVQDRIDSTITAQGG